MLNIYHVILEVIRDLVPVREVLRRKSSRLDEQLEAAPPCCSRSPRGRGVGGGIGRLYADGVQSLEPIESLWPIRLRPAMYIGAATPRHLVEAVVMNDW